MLGNFQLAVVAIPVISGLVGWGTNVLAIKMMFRPSEFVGIPPRLGWQGVIPANATKMGRIASQTLASELIQAEELVEKLEPKDLAEQLEPVILKLTEPIVAEVIEEHLPIAWDQIPDELKVATFARVREELPGEVGEVMAKVTEQIEELIDVQQIAESAFRERAELVPELFHRCGAKEFIFIGRSGLGFGFLFGIIQMLTWLLFPQWWVLPAGGLVVGYLTNWLALKMIFEPLEPTRYGPLTWQGLFLKRQAEVSVAYAELFAKEVLTPQRIVGHLLEGPAALHLAGMVHSNLLRTIEKAMDPSAPMLQQFTSEEQREAIRESIATRLLAALPASVDQAYPYAEEALDIQNELTTNMKALAPTSFVKILRPIFEEDEWILITVGAVLGALAGAAQLFWL